MKSIKKIKYVYSVLAILLIILGGCIVINPEISFTVICQAAGVLLIIYGIVKIISYFTRDLYELAFQFDLAMGIFSLALGGTLFICVKYMFILFPTLIGIIILIDAVFKIQTSLDAKRFGMKKWWCILLIAVLAAAAGFVLILYPLEISKIIMILIGINLMIDGILNLWVVLYTVKLHDSI